MAVENQLAGSIAFKIVVSNDGGGGVSVKHLEKKRTCFTSVAWCFLGPNRPEGSRLRISQELVG